MYTDTLSPNLVVVSLSTIALMVYGALWLFLRRPTDE